MSKPSTPSPGRAGKGQGARFSDEDFTVDGDVAGAVRKKSHRTGDPSTSAATSAEAATPSGVRDATDAAYQEAEVLKEAAQVVDACPDFTSEDIPSSPDQLLEQAQAQAREWQDKCLRLHAEWDTYRRRTTEQREIEKARATEKLVSSLLPVIDDFERTIDYATKNGETGLFEGVKAVHTKLIDVLIKDGVQVLNPQGEPFEALEAQAVATIEDATVDDETVKEVYQKGYKMGTKVLRPAMVTVTTGGPKRKKPQEDTEEK